jgi:serine protease Do
MKSNKLARAVDDPGMIEKTLLQVDIVADRVGRRLVTSGLMAFVVVTWLTAGYLLSGPQVAAAEVDAIGAPAPLGFADIVERVKPTVVGIRVKIEGATQSGEEQQKGPFPPGSSFDRYLRQFGIPHPDSSISKGMAMGSGFFMSGDGYVVTNNHVLANGTNPEVMTDNGTIYSAKIIGADPETDLALIKVSANTNFPYVRFANEPPRIGDWVLPIGNPFGLGGSVTAGIVSARGRDIGEGPYDDFIQIDAPVNVGDSGGPSFNVKGEVIGVNTAIFSPSGGSVGVAFDIPAETVKFVVQELKDKGYVTRGWIGVELQVVTPEIVDAIGLKNSEGALVVQLEPDSPAVKGGVEVADVITSVNNESVKDTRDLVKRLAATPPGSSTKLGVVRNGQEKAITVTVGEYPRTSSKGTAEKKMLQPPVLGLSLAPATAVVGAADRGVVITDIAATSPSAERGLQVGDIIMSVGSHPVDMPADVGRSVEEARTQSKRAVLLRIKRGDSMSFVAVPVV